MPDGETQIAMTGFPAMPPKIAATAAAFIPCPFNEWGPTERPRVPMVEIDGVIQEHTLEAFHRIARWPIDRNEWMRRRGLHV